MGRSGRLAILLLLGLTATCRKQPPAPDVGALVRDLQSTDPQLAGRANLALIGIGEPVVPALLELLGSPDPRVRKVAANTLWGLGAKARAAAPALAAALADEDPELRVMAAMALEGIGPEAQPAVPALVRALNDRDTELRQRAAKALGAMGPAAAGAVPALTAAARFEPVRPAAEEAIRRIRGVEAEAPLEQR
jgi:HEAT repeat protein